MSLALPAAPARLRLRAVARCWPALLPALLFLPMVLAPPLNHDVAAVLSFSERWLAGEQLYVDLIDVNPPLIYVLNLLPAALSRATGIDAIACLQACLVALGFALWRLTLAVRDRAREGAIERVLLDVLPGLIAFGAGYDFGQRETLMAALAFPYLLAAARRMDGDRPRLALLAALLAALGFALKPHFLAVPALVEAAVLLTRLRRDGWTALRDPTPWAMAALWLTYLASLPLLFPDYLGTVVPLVLAYYLDNGGQTPWGLLTLPRLGTAVAFLLPLVILAFRQRGALPRVVALAGLGAVASALAQHKGWSYHIMPIELFACTLATLLAARWLDGLRAGAEGRAVRVAAGLAALFALYLVSEGEAPWNQLTWHNSDAYALTRMLREQAAGERVLVLSPAIAPIYPALNYAQSRMTLRTMNIWLLEGAYLQCPDGGKRYREVWEMGRPEFFLYRTVAEDFSRAPPAAVVIDSLTAIPECGGSAFNLIDYFSRHPLFAEVWSHYAEVGRQGRYTVYARHD
jgi:hypothetical protein